MWGKSYEGIRKRENLEEGKEIGMIKLGTQLSAAIN